MKVSLKDSSSTCKERCLSDDYIDDEYWYQLWYDRRAEDEYDSHIGV